MEPGEQYLGRVTSSNLHKGFMKMGYGVHVTDRRVVGVHPSQSNVLLLVSGFLIAVFGGLVLAILASILFTGSIVASSSYSTMAIVIALIAFFGFCGYLQTRVKRGAPRSFQELPAKTDFSLRREEIALIRLREPTLWHRGELALVTNHGRTLKVMLLLGRGQPSSNEFNQVRTLMQSFCNGSLPVKLDLPAK